MHNGYGLYLFPSFISPIYFIVEMSFPAKGDSGWDVNQVASPTTLQLKASDQSMQPHLTQWLIKDGQVGPTGMLL